MSQATVTGYAGPGLLASGLVIPGITEIDIDITKNLLSLFIGSVRQMYALTGSNTFTLTATGGSYTLTVA